MRTAIRAFIGTLVLLTFGLAISPEQRPKVLASIEHSHPAVGADSARVKFDEIPPQFRQIRRSVVGLNAGIIRSWTPDRGVIELDLTSSAFVPKPYMSVAITGSSYTPKGDVHAYIECEENGNRLPVFRGSVNVNVAEALVTMPANWCPGFARLKLQSKDTFVGIGDVFEISRTSYLKSTFAGRLPYFVTAFVIFSFAMFSGASFATRIGWHRDPLPLALISLGVASLGMFYLSSAVRAGGVVHAWISTVVVLAILVAILSWAGPQVRLQVSRQLRPYAYLWGGGGLVYFAILGLGYNGLGHWEPNYRFWPATWSSDNELQWLFAEAIRHGWDLKGLFGGGWLPTDRPPLMAGAYMLLSDAFRLLQANNDGKYLLGSAYNAAAVLLNGLWVPAAWWLLKTLGRGLNDRGRMAILVFVACIPFVLFNTVYGWPKAFGAAFALLAFGMAWQSRSADAQSNRSMILLFFVLGALSMLAHSSTALFLAPLGLLFLVWKLRTDTRTVLPGFGIALVLVASWSLYKWIVLPSADPVTKYALTGGYGFGHPEWSLWQMMADRYRDLGFWKWLEIKKIMLLQAFLPIDHSITQIGLNSDYGAGKIDKLRAWDFMLLSRGNVVIPVLVLVTAWISVCAFAMRRRDELQSLMPFIALVGISLTAWLLVVLGFLAPAILHHWPQAAVFGLAIGGAVVTQQRAPLVFGLMFVALLSYTGAVWILSPLQHVLAIDPGAAATLAALLAWGLATKLVPAQLNQSTARGTVNDFSFKSVLAGWRTNGTLQRIGNASIWEYGLYLLAALAFSFCTYVTLRYIHQPLADVHAFRQTQTALTAFWMLKEGWTLAYQTPVVGYPWAIPFEFPIYQSLVAAIVAVSGFELEAVGRFVSYLFLVACAWPAFALTKRLELPRSVFWVFCTLLWTSPLYVYWGRTFMIETAALFFSLACMPYALDLIRHRGGWRSAMWFVFFASAAVLQKSTTGGPVLLFLFIAVFAAQARQTGLSFQTMRLAIPPAIVICVPLVIGLAWAHYADVVKMANPFGQQLTSKALGQWNFGTLKQRLDLATWRLVVVNRSFGWNAGGLLGILVLLLPWLTARENRRFAWLSLASLALFLLPVLIFTNLHYVHEYYQTASVAFLLAALAIVIGAWLGKTTGTRMAVTLVTLIFVLSNLSVFSKAYGIVAARTIDELDPRSVQSYKVGRYLRDVTEAGTGLVVFGNAYSSEIAFQAQRKAMAVPPWFKDYSDLWAHPQKYLGDVKLAAIVICPDSDTFPRIKGFPDLNDLQQRLANEPEWVHRSVHGCELLLSPETLKVKSR